MPTTLSPKIRVKLAGGKNYHDVLQIVETNTLHTVCQSARCPNLSTCWGERTATFMILGNVCTRSCRFCAVQHGKPPELDLAEPERVAEAVDSLQCDYAVITSVNRDELADGGAFIFAETVRCIRALRPPCRIELLIPDFCGDQNALDIVLNAEPNVLNHNVETVPRLYPTIQPWSKWEMSLHVLRHAAERGFIAKSGIIVGLGETKEEMFEAIREVRQTGCSILTIGQYLQPTPRNEQVQRMVSEEEFAEYEACACELGFAAVLSGALVRSSFRAKWAYEIAIKRNTSGDNK
ncbi:MAG: lipoyl synthase [Candidatus Omnitrophota bacterium]|jgi:lipoic acid synthetase|nr:MAG: lipoyl synthase [Candidatus Omnitrophota bacterium]